MMQTVIDGITKSVKFDENGHRTEFEVQVSQLNTQGVVPMATWSIETGVKSTSDNAVSAEDSTLMSLKNITFVVLTSLVCLN